MGALMNRFRLFARRRAEDRPRIALVGINYAPELTGIAVYSTGLAEYLAGEGHEVDVYTAFAYYPRWVKAPADGGRLYRRERLNGVNVRRHYLYVPARPTAVRRMLHELSFIFCASVGYLLGPRAEVTFVVSPPLPLGLPMALLARLKGSRLVFHVQDLQPDAALETGLLRPGAFARALLALERWTYAAAHRVSTISRAMLSRIESKGVRQGKTFMLANWANDERIRPRNPDTEFRRDWALGERFVVLYSGNLGVKQGLDVLLDCARLMRGDAEVAFVIVGDGGERPHLAARALRERLDNVQFQPLQPEASLSELLATANVAVIPQRPGITDIVLPSKLGNLLAAERPIVATAYNDSELARTLVNAQCGVVVPPGDAQALAGAIARLKATPLEAARMAANGRRYMSERMSSAALLPRAREALLSA